MTQNFPFKSNIYLYIMYVVTLLPSHFVYVAIPTGSVRLTASTSSSSGIVEVYINSWVTICPSQWDNTDAGVVCRELGYEGGTTDTFLS